MTFNDPFYQAVIKEVAASKSSKYIPVPNRKPWCVLALEMREEEALFAEKIFQTARKKNA